MFPNGNGRVARNAYFILRSNGLIDEKMSSRRTDNIRRACVQVNRLGIVYLFIKEGVIKEQRELDFGNIYYCADESFDEKEKDFFVPAGENLFLKYIAARRVLIRRNEQFGKQIGMKNWPRDKIEEFNLEYKKVRVEWFWECIKVAEENHEHFVSLLDEILIK